MAIFDPNDYPEEKPDSFVVPKGQYELYFSDRAMKYSNGGTQYVECKATFGDGPRKGKYFFHRFFVWNTDKDKEKKARSWLGNFCRATGVKPFDIDSEDEWATVLGKPFIGDVDIEKSTGYDDKNVLLPWGFHKIGSDPEESVNNAGVRPHEDDKPWEYSKPPF